MDFIATHITKHQIQRLRSRTSDHCPGNGHRPYCACTTSASCGRGGTALLRDRLALVFRLWFAFENALSAQNCLAALLCVKLAAPRHCRCARWMPLNLSQCYSSNRDSGLVRRTHRDRRRTAQRCGCRGLRRRTDRPGIGQRVSVRGQRVSTTGQRVSATGQRVWSGGQRVSITGQKSRRWDTVSAPPGTAYRRVDTVFQLADNASRPPGTSFQRPDTWSVPGDNESPLQDRTSRRLGIGSELSDNASRRWGIW
jgi:hypothetical protein